MARRLEGYCRQHGISTGIDRQRRGLAPAMNLPSANRNLLRELVSTGKLRMCWSSAIMESDLPVNAHAVSDDRVRGMLMGLAAIHSAIQRRRCAH
jgi:hypothetical protein